MIWPEPKDLAFVVAAIVAGSFTRISSLSSRDSDISSLKSEWMSVFRSEVAEMSASALYCSQQKCKLGKIKKAMDEGFDADSYIQHEKAFKDLLISAERFQKSRCLLVSKLNRDKDDQKKVHDSIENIRANLNIADDKYTDEECRKIHGLTKDLIDKSNDFAKKEWVSLKSGDGGLRKKIRKQNRIILWVVLLYAVYVCGYSAFASKKSGLDVLGYIGESVQIKTQDGSDIKGFLLLEE